MSTYLIHSPDGNGSSEGVSLPRGCQAVDGTYRAYGPGFPKLLFVLLQRDPQELMVAIVYCRLIPRVKAGNLCHYLK